LNEEKGKTHHCANGLTLGNLAQRSYGISILGDLQTLLGKVLSNQI